MPTYRTRTSNSTGRKRAKRKYPKRLPRDPRKLFRWAASGSNKDYDKLRALARKARHSMPSHIDREAYGRLENVDRLLMIEEIQAHEQHDVSAGLFLDAANWLLDKVPWGNWLWPVSAAQSTINAQKGDGLNEVDEQYARLVGATYGNIDDRPFIIDHWRRQVQFDSSYVSVIRHVRNKKARPRICRLYAENGRGGGGPFHTVQAARSQGLPRPRVPHRLCSGSASLGAREV